MSQEDIFRKVREEIKRSTSTMLANTKPSSDPLTEDTSSDRASPSVSNGHETGGGFEFVSLASSNKPDVSQENKKARDMNNHISPQLLKTEISRKLENIKSQLEIKKNQCLELDMKNKAASTSRLVNPDSKKGEPSAAKSNVRSSAQEARSQSNKIVIQA